MTTFSRGAAGGLTQAVAGEIVRQGYSKPVANLDASAAAVLREFRECASDGADLRFAKSTARALIRQMGVKRSAKAIERVRAMVAAAGTRGVDAGQVVFHRPKRSDFSAADMPGRARKRGLAAIEAAVSGHRD